MAGNKARDLFLGYEKDAEYGKKFAERQITGDVTKTRGRRVRALLDAMHALTNTFSYSSTRSYGMFLMGFGVLSLLLHYTNNYVGGDSVPLYVLILGGILAAFGITLVCFDKPMAIALQEFPVTDFIFFEFFCIKRMHRMEARVDRPRIVTVKPFVALILGFLLAGFGILVPMWYVAATVGLITYLILAFTSPEFSFFSTFLVMPYLNLFGHSELILGFLVLLTFISFAIKVALGKRVYYFEQYDILLGLFLVFILISGIFVKGVESFEASVNLVVLAMGYILCSSLVTNRRLADCVINSVIISAVPVSVFAVSEAVLVISREGFVGFSGVSACFATSGDLAAFLLVSLTMSVYFVTARRHVGTRILFGAIFLLIFAGLLAAASVWALVSALFGVLAYAVARLKRVGPWLVGAVSLLPYSVLFITDDLARTLDKLPVLSSLGLTEKAEVFRSSFRMLMDNLFVGSDSFAEEYAGYGELWGVTNSGNLLLELACEAGVFALLVFAVIFIVRMRHRSVYRHYIQGSEVGALTRFTAVTMAVMLVFGAMNYLWAETTINYLFWCIFGIGSATLRISKSSYDDWAGYFSDGRSFDSSSLDISLS